MLHAAQFAVSRRSLHANVLGKQSSNFSPLKQGNVAHVVGQFWVRAGLHEDQVLNGKLGIHHATRTVLHIKKIGLDGVCCSDPIAHGHDFRFQSGFIAGRADDAASNLVKLACHRLMSHHKACPRHRLMLPSPCCVAASLLLIVLKCSESGYQQT